MSVAETIKLKLEDAFAPDALEVIDESHLHEGHAGARPEGETHFRVTIVSPRFDGVSRVRRQQMVYKTLEKEMQGPVHALALRTLSPAEVARENGGGKS